MAEPHPHFPHLRKPLKPPSAGNLDQKPAHKTKLEPVEELEREPDPCTDPGLGAGRSVAEVLEQRVVQVSYVWSQPEKQE